MMHEADNERFALYAETDGNPGEGLLASFSTSSLPNFTIFDTWRFIAGVNCPDNDYIEICTSDDNGEV